MVRSLGVALLLMCGVADSVLPVPRPVTLLRVGVADMPPDIYLDEHGAMRGILGTLLREMAARERWVLVPRACDWPECLRQLRAGELDLLPNVAYSAERERYLAYHETPVLFRSSQLYSRPGETADSVGRLAHKRVAVLAGSVQEGMIRMLLARGAPGSTVEPVADLAEGFARVHSGEADAAVADVSVGGAIAPRYQLVPSTVVLPTTKIFYAAPRGSETMVLAAIDRYLRAWKADPGSIYFQALSRLDPLVPPATASSPWLTAVLAGLLLAFSAGALVLLQRQRRRIGLLQEVMARPDVEPPGLVGHVHALAPATPPTLADTLIDPPNRDAAIARIGQALVAARLGGSIGGVLVFNLDGFRKINDTHGRVAGDAVLRQVASRLLDRPLAGTVVSRTDGDEFTVLIASGHASLEAGAAHALQVAENLRRTLTGAPVAAAGHLHTLRLSVGVALLHGASGNAEAALREATLALQEARLQGGDRSVLFDERLRVRRARRLALETDLPAALQTDAFSVHLQPQYARDGVVTGAELLARWTHPVHGAVSPMEFIPLARETGQLHALTLRVLALACGLLPLLRENGEDYPLSINVSAEILADPLFVQRALRMLAHSHIAAGCLMFEVTEEIRIVDMTIIVQHMRDLGAAGVLFSVDDFGMDYANLGYLARLPLYELKIDRSLVDGLPEREEHVAIVLFILTLARRLDLKVVAEGVETEAQARFLFSHRCDAVQGYLMCAPVPVADWLDRDARRAGTISGLDGG